MFDQQGRERTDREAPLAARMRPRTLDEFVGQDHVVGPARSHRHKSTTLREPVLSLDRITPGEQSV